MDYAKTKLAVAIDSSGLRGCYRGARRCAAAGRACSTDPRHFTERNQFST
jgi:hypothetical protein